MGAISFDNESEVGCVADIKEVRIHDQAVEQSARSRQFDSSVTTKSIVNISANNAFRQTQRGNCGFIYGATETLKILLNALAPAGLKSDVLPIWIAPADIAKRVQQLASEKQNSQQAEGERQSELQKHQAEAAAARKAESEQLENRQRQYRAQNGAKVASLVSSIDQKMAEARGTIDKAVLSRQGLETAIDDTSFW